MLGNLKHLRDAIRAPAGGSGSAAAAPKGGTVSDHADDSPFVLVECGLDGLWHVYEEGTDTPGSSVFNELREACNHASSRARVRRNRMVLVREKHGPVVNAYYPAKHGTLSRLFDRMWR